MGRDTGTSAAERDEGDVARNRVIVTAQKGSCTWRGDDPVQTPSEEVATMSTWSAGRSGTPAASAAESSPAPGAATRPYIEGIIEALGHAGDQPVLRWDGAGTTGS